MAGEGLRLAQWPSIPSGKHPFLTLEQEKLPPTALALLDRCFGYLSFFLIELESFRH